MLEVRIFTADGCKGCKIAVTVAEAAINQLNKEKLCNAILEIQPFDRDAKDICIEHDIKDFPTTHIIKNHEIVDTLIGTYTKQELIGKLIDALNDSVDKE